MLGCKESNTQKNSNAKFIKMDKKNPAQGRHLISQCVRIVALIPKQTKTEKSVRCSCMACHLSNVACHLSPCHLSIMLTATATNSPLVNSPIMQSRLVYKDRKTRKTGAEKNCKEE